MDTPLSPSATPFSRAFADHLDLMFGTRERAIKTPGSEQDHVEVWRCIDGAGRRYFRKRFLQSEQSGVDYRLWINREFKLLIELSSEDLRHVQQYRNITNLGSGEQQLETLDAGPDGDQWQQVPVARNGHRLPHLFVDCGHWFGLARWLLAALDEVHALGFVHVDLKADNFCLPAHRLGEAADGYPARIQPRWEQLKLIDFAFSVWENRVALPPDMPLPIGESERFRYQSAQLLAALGTKHSPPVPDLELTRRLDWRVDLYGLGFALEQILAEAERLRLPEDGNWGWTEKRHDQARHLIESLNCWDRYWRRPAPVERPHGALIALLDRLLGEDDLAASLAGEWKIVRDPNWRPQDPSVRTPPTVPAPRRRSAGTDPKSVPTSPPPLPCTEPIPLQVGPQTGKGLTLLSTFLKKVFSILWIVLKKVFATPPPKKKSGFWKKVSDILGGIIIVSAGIAALKDIKVVQVDRVIAEQGQQRSQEIEQAKPEETAAQTKAEADRAAAQAKAKADRAAAQAKAKADRAAAQAKERAQQQQAQADQDEAKRKRLEADKATTLTRLEAAKNLLEKGNIPAARLALKDAGTLDREGLAEAFRRRQTANLQAAALAFLEKGQRSLAEQVMNDLGQWDPQSAEYRALRTQMAK